MTMTYIRAHHGPARLFLGQPQYIDLKQLADLEHSFRQQCRAAIRQYRGWKHDHTQSDDPLERHYRSLEGALLRRRAEDAVRLHALIKKDMRRSFHKYIAASLKTKF